MIATPKRKPTKINGPNNSTFKNLPSGPSNTLIIPLMIDSILKLLPFALGPIPSFPLP